LLSAHISIAFSIGGMMMSTSLRILGVSLVLTALLGCGAETATTAATAATAANIKKQELEQGQKTMEQVQQKLDQSLQQMQQAPARADSAN
jgi:curli biogenesis system outer membrane secretion channel CsgG